MEENKVRERLLHWICAAARQHKEPCKLCEHTADTILQSSDLRVTIVEPKYAVKFGTAMCSIMYGCSAPPETMVLVSDGNSNVAHFPNTADGIRRAGEYAAWLNSKEPK